jgi:hypothetical protein
MALGVALNGAIFMSLSLTVMEASRKRRRPSSESPRQRFQGATARSIANNALEN